MSCRKTSTSISRMPMEKTEKINIYAETKKQNKIVCHRISKTVYTITVEYIFVTAKYTKTKQKKLLWPHVILRVLST